MGSWSTGEQSRTVRGRVYHYSKVQGSSVAPVMRLVSRLVSGYRVRLFFGTRKAAVWLFFLDAAMGRFITISALAKNAIVWESLFLRVGCRPHPL